MNSPIPDPHERAPLNQDQLHTGAEPGFWDNHERPAPRPDDIEQWHPATSQPINPEPGQPPF